MDKRGRPFQRIALGGLTVSQLKNSAHKCRTFKFVSGTSNPTASKNKSAPLQSSSHAAHLRLPETMPLRRCWSHNQSALRTPNKYETAFHSNTPMTPALSPPAYPCIGISSYVMSHQGALSTFYPTPGAQTPFTHCGPTRVLPITLLLPTTSRGLFYKDRVPGDGTDQIRRTQWAFSTADSVFSGPSLLSHVQKKHQPPEKVHLQSLEDQMSLIHVHHTNRLPHSTRVRTQPCQTSPRYPTIR